MQVLRLSIIYLRFLFDFMVRASHILTEDERLLQELLKGNWISAVKAIMKAVNEHCHVCLHVYQPQTAIVPLLTYT